MGRSGPKKVNPTASLGVAVREYPTSTGPVDYALFVDGKPVGVIEAKKDELGENITVVEGRSGRYANSTFKYITTDFDVIFLEIWFFTIFFYCFQHTAGRSHMADTIDQDHFT